MPQPVPAKYKSSDGSEFDTWEEALEHEKLGNALAAYKKALDVLNVAIASKLKTSDGHPFQLQGDYYYLADVLGEPSIHKAYLKNWTLEIDEYDFARISIHVVTGGDHFVRVDDLYFSEKEAKKQMLYHLECRLSSCKKKVLDLKRELGGFNAS